MKFPWRTAPGSMNFSINFVMELRKYLQFCAWPRATDTNSTYLFWLLTTYVENLSHPILAVNDMRRNRWTYVCQIAKTSTKVSELSVRGREVAQPDLYICLWYYKRPKSFSFHRTEPHAFNRISNFHSKDKIEFIFSQLECDGLVQCKYFSASKRKEKKNIHRKISRYPSMHKNASQ